MSYETDQSYVAALEACKGDEWQPTADQVWGSNPASWKLDTDKMEAVISHLADGCSITCKVESFTACDMCKGENFVDFGDFKDTCPICDGQGGKIVLANPPKLLTEVWSYLQCAADHAAEVQAERRALSCDW